MTDERKAYPLNVIVEFCEAESALLEAGFLQEYNTAVDRYLRARANLCAAAGVSRKTRRRTA